MFTVRMTTNALALRDRFLYVLEIWSCSVTPLNNPWVWGLSESKQLDILSFGPHSLRCSLISYDPSTFVHKQWVSV